ncbi:MAG: hypothetical protein ACJAV2_005174 [Myxococcota bacterium]|jgi:hypothetical protein
MDLIGALTSQLGIDSNKAEAVAGGVLGAIRGQVADNGSPEAAAQLDSAVPQLGGWMEKAKSMLADPSEGPAVPQTGGGIGDMLGAALGGGGGGLLGAAAGMLGGKEAQDIAKVGVLMNGLGLDASKTAMAAPIVVGFLKDKLGAGTFDMILKAAPMLSALKGTGGDDGGAAGGIAGAIGGLFG